MGFDKNYPNRKDKRKPLRGAAIFDSTCRHGGSCSWCKGNRTHRNTKQIEKTNNDLKDATDRDNT